MSFKPFDRHEFHSKIKLSSLWSRQHKEHVNQTKSRDQATSRVNS